MLQFKSESGADIIINPAPWKDAKELKRAFVVASIPLDKIDFQAENIDAILDRLIVWLDGAEKFEAALWPCLIRCTRNGIKITVETFDDPAARADYYPIIKGCSKENLRPLLEEIFSQFIVQTSASKASASDTPA